MLVNADVVCPPAADYAPCTCDEFLPSKPGTINLNCYFDIQLTDSQVSGVLDALLATPGVSPVRALSLQFTQQLTQVPSQTKSFNQLDTFYIFGSSITADLNATVIWRGSSGIIAIFFRSFDMGRCEAGRCDNQRSCDDLVTTECDCRSKPSGNYDLSTRPCTGKFCACSNGFASLFVSSFSF